MLTRPFRFRRPWWALLALAALIACGPTAPTGPGGGTLAALTLTIDPQPAAYGATPLTITAKGASGAVLSSFQGAVSLEFDDGSVSPATVTLNGGTATVDVSLAGTIGEPRELTARHGAIEGRATLELGPITTVPGAATALVADALPFLAFRPRAGDYAPDAPDLPGLDLSFTTVTLVLDPGATVGDFNALLVRHAAGVVAVAAGPVVAVRLTTTHHAAMLGALGALRAEPLVLAAHREQRFAVPRESGEELAASAIPAPPQDGKPAGWTWEREDQSQPNPDDNWGLERIRVPQLWNLNTAVRMSGAAPPLVGVLDFGFPIHPADLDYFERVAFTDQSPLESADDADNDHGTLVAGIIGATFGNGDGVDGVNPFARLVVAPFGPVGGWGLLELLQRRPDLRVVNASIGFNWYQQKIDPTFNTSAQSLATSEGTALHAFLTARRAAGERVPLIVVAAGNDSFLPTRDVDARWGSTAGYAALALGNPDIVVVEAAERKDGGLVRRRTSNGGGHVSAPGAHVCSTLASALYGCDDGTSFAAPIVAGVASYLLAFDPTLSNAQIVQALTGTAEPMTGMAPLVDAFAAAIKLDDIRGNLIVLRDLTNVDDGTDDGNLRIDPFSGAMVPVADGDPFGQPGDFVVTMRDFRRFRDALLLVEGAAQLDGGREHPKRDLNGDGNVDTPARENVFPRFDFNGDGRISRTGTASVPGFAQPVTDLQVLQRAWQDPDVFAHELDALLDSGDLHVDAREAFADARVGAVEVEFRDEAERGVRTLTLDRDRPMVVATLPVDMYEAIIRLLDQGGLLLDERTEAFGVGAGADWAIRVDAPAPLGGQLLAAGDRHALALLADRTVVAWGDAILGDGNATGSPTPVAVAGLTDVVSVAAGQDFSLALKADGTVWSWGSGFRGKLGHGDTDDRLVPTRIGGLDGVVAIAAKSNHAMALRENGSVVDWGFMSNYEGSPGERSVPTPVPGVANAAAIQAGAFALVAVADGPVVGWGRNNWMQLGDGTTLERATPVPALGVFGAVAVTGGGTHGLALLEDGTVAGWGLNLYAGLGSVWELVSPAPVTGPDVVVRAISSYSTHTLALTDGGDVLAWGSSLCGELGDGLGLEEVNFPLQITTVEDVVAVAAGFDFSLFALRDGSVRSVGCNRNGQLGDGTTLDRELPVRVLGITDVARP
jgi:alpha-tubulin suppressor-like RCC1 family protein